MFVPVPIGIAIIIVVEIVIQIIVVVEIIIVVELVVVVLVVIVILLCAKRNHAEPHTRHMRAFDRTALQADIARGGRASPMEVEEKATVVVYERFIHAIPYCDHWNRRYD